MNKLLTIVIPSFNMEKYLDRCLSTLIISDPKMDAFEVLVINDGSTDRTSEIARSYETRFPKTFRVIDKENGHYGSCINRGLQEAKGIFIKILDADDGFDHIVFESFLSFLSELSTDKCDLVISGYREVTTDGFCKKEHPFSDYPPSALVKDITESDLNDWFIHALTYRTAFLRDINYHQSIGISYTDLEWAFIPMSTINSIKKFPGFLYLYTTGVANQSIDPAIHAKNLWMEAKVVSNILVFYENVKPTLMADNLAFLKKRLLIIINHIYQLYLLTYRRFIPSLTPLYELDRLLKNNDKDLYNETSTYVTTIARIPFRPVHNWRNHRVLMTMIQTSLYFIADKLFSLRKRKTK